MLHNDDRNLLMLNEHDPFKVYCMDVERGSVVEEWTPDEVSRVQHIAPSNKFEPSNTFLACNNKSLFTMDPRVSYAKAVQSKSYSGNPKFSCISSNVNGNIAVGSETGEIRLYKQIG